MAAGLRGHHLVLLVHPRAGRRRQLLLAGRARRVQRHTLAQRHLVRMRDRRSEPGRRVSAAGRLQHDTIAGARIDAGSGGW